MSKSYPDAVCSAVRVPRSLAPVTLTVRLPGAVAAALDIIRVADCYSFDCEPVLMSIFLSWYICRAVESMCDITSGGRSAHYEDIRGVVHSVTPAARIPFMGEFGPGDFVQGVPWWMAGPVARRRARIT